MTKGVLFWVLMLLWVVFGLVGFFQPYPGNWNFIGTTLFIFILFAIIGWKVFGSPVQG